MPDLHRMESVSNGISVIFELLNYSLKFRKVPFISYGIDKPHRSTKHLLNEKRD